MKCILYIADAASIHTRRWAEHYRDQGLDIHICSFRTADIPGVHVHKLPTAGLGRMGYFFAIPVIRRIARRLRPDLVHAHFLTSYGFLAARAGLHPLVVTAWGSDALIAPKNSRLLRYFASYAVMNADVVTTLAAHMNASVADLGVSLELITSTPFGVDADFFRLPLSGKLERQQLRLICTRNFDVVYDVGTLIRALAQVFASGRKLVVDLVGAGPLHETLNALVREMKLESHINFHGHVDHQFLAGLLAGSDIFVSPALSDGNNVSLNEAMACGCFPIASNIPANAQWIMDGVNGYLYPPGDVTKLAQAIEMAIEKTELRISARTVNRAIIENRVDWRICVKRMDDIYKQVIGLKDSGR